MIGALSKEPETCNLPELLLLTTRCAIGADIRGAEVPRLTELATLTKPKRVGVEARRLEETLTALGFTASATGA